MANSFRKCLRFDAQSQNYLKEIYEKDNSIAQQTGREKLSENQIVMDALLHEMERYNKAMDLVTDENARHAIQRAKDKVYRVHQKVCRLLVDEEQHEGYKMD